MPPVRLIRRGDTPPDESATYAMLTLLTAIAPFLAAASVSEAQTATHAAGEERVYSEYVNSDIESTDVRRRVRDFQRTLRMTGHKGKVLSCSTLVQISRGTVTSNLSYGGFCKVAVRGAINRYALCNDKMVGHWAMTENYEQNRSWLVKFVTSECVGG
jgi:hypothetical protein